MKIIDFGMDKSYESFVEDLNSIMQPFRLSDSLNNVIIEGYNDFKPITSYRKYLNSSFDIKKLVFKEKLSTTYKPSDFDFNLWDLYTKSFKDFYNKYFNHLNDDDEYDDSETKNKKFRVRNNIYQDFKLKICLVEDDNMFNHFLKQIWNFYEKVKEFHEAVQVSHFHDTNLKEDIRFWSQFVRNILDLEPKYMIYLIPYNLHPDNKNKNPHQYYTSMLSEHIANNDYIYQTLIYNSWMVNKDCFELARHKGLISNMEKKFGFETP